MELLQSLKHRSCIYQLIAEHEPPVPSIRGADQPSTRNKLFYSVAVDQRNDCPCWEDKNTCSLMHSLGYGKNEHAI